MTEDDKIVKYPEDASLTTRPDFFLQSPYFNRSAMSLRKDFSLHRAYIIFRSLGLRHLTVTGI